MRRYPYSRMHSRRWCRVCNVIRNVRLKWSRDMHVCLSCGACTSGIQEWDHKVIDDINKMIMDSLLYGETFVVLEPT